MKEAEGDQNQVRLYHVLKKHSRPPVFYVSLESMTTVLHQMKVTKDKRFLGDFMSWTTTEDWRMKQKNSFEAALHLYLQPEASQEAHSF